MRQLYEILIPMRNRGMVMIPAESHQHWDEFVSQRCGGLTIMPHSMTGVWRGTEGKQREEMLPVRVACTRAQLLEILQFTAKFYEQKSVMAYEVSHTVFFSDEQPEGAPEEFPLAPVL